MLGKLKRSLKERCPECGKILQLRVIEEEVMEDGVIFFIPKEYISCSNKNCDYERGTEQKRRRKSQHELLT